MAGRRAVAGDADRDRILGLLREHYAVGTIDDAELDRRTGIVLGARFTDQAVAAVEDLPLLPARGQPIQGRAERSLDRHRHAQASRPGAGWVPTSERFRDPASREIMRVWVDPADGSRHYVPEQPG
jgi:uncharacterized protein DUF1707